MPSWLNVRLPSFQATVTNVDDLSVTGRDATGPKSEIPWVRLYSRSLSPNPQNGWYAVYLFEGIANVSTFPSGMGAPRMSGLTSALLNSGPEPPRRLPP